MLPRVSVQAALGEPPTVTVDGNPVPGVRSVQVTVSKDAIPQVALVLAADTVDVELPAGVSVLRAGGSLADFADALNPARLEALALAAHEQADLTQGEAFAAAVAQLAAEHDG